MRITKVVTKHGDKGTTSLVGGKIVSKAATRVEVYGDVDELNSFLGVARTEIKDTQVDDILRKIQNDLFTLGADLASLLSVAVPRVETNHVSALETIIDTLLQELEPLKEFILPGGGKAGSLLHVARTIARRAERKAVKLSEEEEINKTVLVYLNRLSDLLFVLARAVNKRSGLREEQAKFTADNKKR
jgi:cob(I)alamin adenosyltransferase